MKKINILITAILMVASYSLTAQVAITIDGSSADNSAMLDVKSTNKGFSVATNDSPSSYRTIASCGFIL